MIKRIIAMMLAASMTMSVVGCGGGSSGASMSEKLFTEAVLNKENLVLGKDGIELRLDPVMISSDINASIYEVQNAPTLDDDGEISLEVYDFRLDGISKVDGVIQLAIPIEISDGEIPGAAYLNEETMKWEPVAFMYDSDSSTAVIMTDHLSKYGVFKVPALFEKAWTDGVLTRTITFRSTGDVSLYTSSQAIDSSKGVVVHENGIENLNTTGVILEFENPVNQVSGTAENYLKTVWEDKTEKEETSTNEITFDAINILPSASKIYFKYPAS